MFYSQLFISQLEVFFVQMPYENERGELNNGRNTKREATNLN